MEEMERLITDPAIRAEILSHPGVQALMNGDMVKNISAEKLASILVDVLAGSGEALEYLERLTNSAMVNQMLANVGDPLMRQRLEKVLATARSLPDARLKLIEWFDSGLNRMGELYKRRMQYFSLLIGALLAILLNVDTLYVSKALWNDPVLRQSTVEAAMVAMENVDPTAETPIGESVEIAREAVSEILELRIPVGWYYETVTPDSLTVGTLDRLQDTRNLWNLWPPNNALWFTLLLEKLVGLALTTIAVMQGAPFWFDLLKRASGR
jgi:hypothetical protein